MPDPTTAELRAAAERLRRRKSGESSVAIYGHFGDAMPQRTEDQKILADAYLAAADRLERMDGHWTDTPPTEPGWYWWKLLPTNAAEMQHIRVVDGMLGGPAIGWFAGPLKPPAHPPQGESR